MLFYACNSLLLHNYIILFKKDKVLFDIKDMYIKDYYPLLISLLPYVGDGYCFTDGHGGTDL